MVLYQQIVYAVPKLPSSVLAIMFRRHAETVIANGGVVRMVENQGLRPLQARATKKFATLDGTRHFWEAKFITVTFDVSPTGLKEVERTLKNEEGIIRFFTTKVDSGQQRFNTRTFQNPYMKSVPYMKFKQMPSIPPEYNLFNPENSM